MYMTKNTPCIICRQKNNFPKENRLNQILSIIRMNQLAPADKYDRLTWSLHVSCRYGLSCSLLNQKEMNCKRMAQQIDVYMPNIIASDARIYYDILSLMQGEFPNIYVYMERKRAKRKSA